MVLYHHYKNMVICIGMFQMHQNVPITVFFTLGSGSNTKTITTNNTEILITNIGEEASGGMPRLTCRTDLTACCRNRDTDSGGAGQWTYPDGEDIQNNASSVGGFYINRDIAQLIRLNRREGNNPLSPTGSYCCTVPTTGGDMTLCANLGE